MGKLAPIVVLILLLTASCSEKAKPGNIEVKREIVTGVALVKVSTTEIESYYQMAGTVKARATSLISARTMGSILSLKVKEGDRVTAGQELIVLDDRDMRQKVSAAEAGYRGATKAVEEAQENKRLADITFRRYRNLAYEKVISQHEMDQVETQQRVADLGYDRAREMANMARSQLEEARVTRSFTRITAPHAGVITEKRTEQGSMAVPGMPLLVLQDISQYEMEVYVDQRLTGNIEINRPVRVVLPGQERQVTGTIGKILPAVDPSTRSFAVKVYLKDGSLRSGMYGRVLIPAGKKQGILIPGRAVVEKGQLTGVYIVDDHGVMAYRIIRTGQVQGDLVEVVSGIKPGERIAVSGLERAIDGGVVNLE